MVYRVVAYHSCTRSRAEHHSPDPLFRCAADAVCFRTCLQQQGYQSFMEKVLSASYQEAFNTSLPFRIGGLGCLYPDKQSTIYINNHTDTFPMRRRCRWVYMDFQGVYIDYARHSFIVFLITIIIISITALCLFYNQYHTIIEPTPYYKYPPDPTISYTVF